MILGKVQDKDNWRFVFRFKKPQKIYECSDSLSFGLIRDNILRGGYKLVGITWYNKHGIRYIYTNKLDI